MVSATLQSELLTANPFRQKWRKAPFIRSVVVSRVFIPVLRSCQDRPVIQVSPSLGPTILHAQTETQQRKRHRGTESRRCFLSSFISPSNQRQQRITWASTTHDRSNAKRANFSRRPKRLRRTIRNIPSISHRPRLSKRSSIIRSRPYLLSSIRLVKL